MKRFLGQLYSTLFSIWFPFIFHSFFYILIIKNILYYYNHLIKPHAYYYYFFIIITIQKVLFISNLLIFISVFLIIINYVFFTINVFAINLFHNNNTNKLMAT